MNKSGPSAHSDANNKISVWAPASISNLGPGFDCLGMAIQPWGDVIEISENPGGDIDVSFHEESPWSGPTMWQSNTAGVSARIVLAQLGVSTGVRLVINKGIVPGSGIGSSAASAVAAAVAVNELYGSPLNKSELLEAALQGEAIASGSKHGDNVLPSLFGGMVIASSEKPEEYDFVRLETVPWFAVCVPQLEIRTMEARSVLPKEISLEEAVAHASRLALLVSDIKKEDWEAVGHRIMTDQIVEPVRARLNPLYHPIKNAAMANGAYGCALSGSGPAMFAVCGDELTAQRVCDAMSGVVASEGHLSRSAISTIALGGACRIVE